MHGNGRFSSRETLQLDPLHRRPEGRKRAVAVAVQTGGAGSSSPAIRRKRAAEEHHHDRADRLRARPGDSRRLARLGSAPFLKVEATKYTEVGYLGRDVDHGPRSARVGIGLMRDKDGERCARRPRRRPRSACIDAPGRARLRAATRRGISPQAAKPTRLDDKEVEIEVADRRGRGAVRRSRRAGRGRVGMSISATCSARPSAKRTKPRRMTVGQDARHPCRAGGGEAARQGAVDAATRSAAWRTTASSSSTRSTRSRAGESAHGADVSREGVQRDLLPIVEGTTVATKYGPVKTDHILFIAPARSTRQAVRPDAGAAGPLPDPRGAAAS